MADAYVIEAVRTAVGKRNGSLAGVHPVDLGAAAWRGCVRPGRRRPGRRRRCDRRLCGRHRRTGRQHRAAVVAGRRLSRRGARRHRRSPVRIQPAGHLLWRPGDHVRHRRPDRGRRHAEHEPDPHLIRHDRRRAVRFHLSDQRVQGLAAPLRRPGDLAVPRFGADRREVGASPARRWRSSRCAATSGPSPRSEPATSTTRSSGRTDGPVHVDEGPRETSLEKMAGLKTAGRGRPADRGDGQPDLRRCQRGAAGLRAGGQGPRSDATRPHPPHQRPRRRPGVHADRPDPGHPATRWRRPGCRSTTSTPSRSTRRSRPS